MSYPQTKPFDTIMHPLKWAGYTVAFLLVFTSIWMIYAPLATTINANGTLISSQPNYKIQHPYGGQIKHVFIEAQQNIKKGQKILTINTDIQAESLRQVQTHISTLVLENTIISHKLKNKKDIPAQVPLDHTLFDKYQTLEDDLSFKLHSIYQTITTKSDHVTLNQDGIDILIKRRKYLQKRARNFDKLIAKGAVSAVQAETQIDQLLEVEGEINDRYIIRRSNQNEIQSAKIETDKLKTEHRLSLLNRLEQNKSRLLELRRQARTLEDEIKLATIIAPNDGFVVSLNFDTEEMYITRGTTLLVLSQPLQHPRIKMVIPATAVDQSYIGMIGKMIIPSLPQRNIPNVNIKLTSISPEAMKDETGQTVGYQAYAAIVPKDLNALQHSLKGDLNLATDMPVNLSLVGRTTTLYQYLIAPFFYAFDGAIQD